MATYLRIGAVGAGGDDLQIRGDVADLGHEGWIELDGFGFGSGSSHDEDDDDESGVAGGRIESQASPKPLGKSAGKNTSRLHEKGFTFEMSAGSHSSPVIQWATDGEVYDLQIDCCQDSGQPFMRLWIYKARIQAFEQQAGEGIQVADESVDVVFERFDLESLSFGSDLKQLPSVRRSTTSPKEALSRKAPLAAAAVVGPASTATAPTSLDSAPTSFPEVDFPHDFIQANRVLSVEEVGGVKFLLGGFTGVEQLSTPFTFNLEVTAAADQDVSARSMIGQPISFRIEDAEGNSSDAPKSETREFHGIVSEVTAYSHDSDATYRDYDLTVVPWFWFLKQRSNCRVFQNRTVLEIVEAVFKDAGFSDFELSAKSGKYPKLEYCVQYRETDFDFVSRLLEEAGVFYFFRFKKGSHTMVLGDAVVDHDPCAESSVEQTSGSGEGKRVRNWVHRKRHVPGSVRIRDYNYTTPGETLEVSESVAAKVVEIPKISKFELYDYPGRYGTPAIGGDVAKVRMQAHEVSHAIVFGDSNCDSFCAGSRFKIASHDNEKEVGNEYVLTFVKHSVALMPGSEIDPRLAYQNRFECIPKAVVFRPSIRTARPMIHGPQTAVVVGKEGEEIYPDDYGAVKVQFHWDRVGGKNQDSSCFVRVAQPIAGRGWGGLWLPRIGQEVVVHFLEGDPDRPLITGSVYNKDNAPPYKPTERKSVSTIKSRSTKEGSKENFNELRFDDEKGKEQIYLHAERNFDRRVELDDTLTVGTDKKGGQTVEIEEQRSVTVKHGDDTLTVGSEGNGSLIISVEKDRRATIIGGDDSLEVQGGDHSVAVAAGTSSVEAEKGINLKTASDVKVDASGKVKINAKQGIELVCGGCSIKMDPTGITIKGTKIAIQGTGPVEIKGLKVQMAGNTMVEIKGLMTDIKGSGMLKAGGGIMMLG